MEQGANKEITEALAERHACYVLITCDSPSSDGEMNVEMNYEGDPTLAAYLLHSAQGYLEKDDPDDDLDFDQDSNRYIQ